MQVLEEDGAITDTVGAKDHLNLGILQAMVSGNHLVLGFRTNVWVRCVYVGFGAPSRSWEKRCLRTCCTDSGVASRDFSAAASPVHLQSLCLSGQRTGFRDTHTHK